jgi:hypothetical protein
VKNETIPIVALEDSVRRVPIEMYLQELGWQKGYGSPFEHHWSHPDRPNQQFMLSEACFEELKANRRRALAAEKETSNVRFEATLWLVLLFILVAVFGSISR